MAVWNKIEELAVWIEQQFQQTGQLESEPLDQYDWYNRLYTSTSYRRAHIQIVDKRSTHKIYILHATIFPHTNDPSPIWGFDAVCGLNKITGAFHDFSPAGDPEHSMCGEFARIASSVQFTRQRELPQWAQQIFGSNMVAAGNIKEDCEIDNLCDLAKTSLNYYLDHVGLSQESLFDYHMAQDRYCYYQKKNPHVVRSMVNMGVEEAKIREFVDKVLFPEFDKY